MEQLWDSNLGIYVVPEAHEWNRRSNQLPRRHLEMYGTSFWASAWAGPPCGASLWEPPCGSLHVVASLWGPPCGGSRRAPCRGLLVKAYLCGFPSGGLRSGLPCSCGTLNLEPAQPRPGQPNHKTNRWCRRLVGASFHCSTCHLP